MIKGSWVLTALINFLIAATFGLLMRAAFVWEIEWMDYRHVLHAHSHVAMLGWIYLILFALFVDRFVAEDKKEKSIYSILFWLTQATVIGMMISFPLEGYGPFSITFSGLHVVLSYFFAWRIWKDLPTSGSNSTVILKASLIALVFSTLGVWGMGPIMAFSLQNNPLYFVSIQFYLHFQFNGWFILAVFALLFQVLSQYQIEIKRKPFRIFLSLYLIGLLGTFFHVMAWAYGTEYYFILNSGGALFQLASVIYLLLILIPQLREKFKNTPKYVMLLLVLALMGLAFKALFQGFLVIPPIAEVSTIIRNFMIGYVHLITLGIATMLIFLSLKESLRDKINFNWGLPLFLIGFLGTEIMLFLQGLFYWLGMGMVEYYYELLFVLTLFLPIGLVLIIVINKRIYVRD